MKIEVFAEPDRAAGEAARIVAAEARKAVAERGQFTAAFSGGHTPWVMLRALADEDVPWDKVRIAQVDERAVPAGDRDRNLTHLRESLLDHAPLRPEHIYAMPVEECNLTAAAGHYALVVMTVVAVLLMPIVLLYQGWSFRVFRRRVTAPPEPGGTGPSAS